MGRPARDGACSQDVGACLVWTHKRTHEVTLPALTCRMPVKPEVATTTSLSAKVRGWDELPDAVRPCT